MIIFFSAAMDVPLVEELLGDRDRSLMVTYYDHRKETKSQRKKFKRYIRQLHKRRKSK